MDAYPQELITHEAPLLVISGLGAPESYSEIPAYPLINAGPHIFSDLPPLTDEPAERLAEYFHKSDATGLWGKRPDRGAKAAQHPVFRIRLVGRDYRLPPRKANPPSPGIPSAPTDGSPTRVLHSPISPLSPESPLFPDGALSHIWLRKHQSVIPAVFAAFFTLDASTNNANLQNIEDNKIVDAINSAKQHFLTSSNSSLTQAVIGSEELRTSGHRTKFVVVMLADRSIMASGHVDERLTAIRRAAGLITNSTYFVASSSYTPQELEQFVGSLLATLYPGVVDYYRDMSKHARRKRNRGSPASPTIPASRALSAQGWTLRYEFKLGVFAEFRQEMENAGRNYETAYEKLLTEVFEATSSWSERWSEARMLSDILMLRIIRCNLWLENYLVAKQRWSYHVVRMRDVLDRKGKGTETYGFAAWLSRWNKCLADLLHLANLPVFSVNIPVVRTTGLLDQDPPVIYYRPDRIGERLAAVELLHHPGFYYLAAADLTRVRESRARRINLEDKDTADTYLCPHPKEEREVDHAAIQMTLLILARIEFDLRQQERMVEAVSYQLAKLRMLKAPENPKFWLEALKDLRGTASRYRKEGWWNLLEDVLWKIVECGRRGGDAGSVVLAEFELLCSPIFKARPGRTYDLTRCLEGMDKGSLYPTIVARASDVVNIFSVSYAFEFPTVHAGQAVNSQLSISSIAHPSSAPLVFKELKITYEGSLKTVLLRHKPSESSERVKSVQIINLQTALYEAADGEVHSPTSIASHTYLVAETDLSIGPGETKVFELSQILREAGAAKAICCTFGMVNDSFDLDFVSMFGEDDVADAVHPLPIKNISTTPNGGTGVWWLKDASGIVMKRPLRSKPDSLNILPRPPKMEVSAKGLDGGIYTDEVVKIGLEVVNGEDEDADVGVDVKIIGWQEEQDPEITWLSDGDGPPIPPTPSLYSLGTVKPSESTTRYFTFPSSVIPADCVLEIKLRYTLVSDPETTTEKVVLADMPIIAPFVCNYDFSPRVHPGAWPDYFSLDDELFNAVGKEEPAGKKLSPQGIIQRWCLTASVLGMGDDIVLEGWELPLEQLAGAAECNITTTPQKPTVLEPQTQTKLPFLLNILKPTLEDRSPSTIDSTLLLRWRRTTTPPTAPPTTTILPVPRLFVPLREPRVLCEAHASRKAPGGIVELTYTLENPTNYFLTFGVLMETNDEFAFSGPKQMNIALLPVSKAAIEYRLLPYARERWVRPNLKVVDRYFNKTLKTAPGGEGVAVDKTGLMVWVPEDLEVEEEVKEEVKEVKEVKEVVVEEVIGSDENTRDDKLTDIAAGKEEETKEEVEGEDDDDDEDDSDYVDESSSDDDPEEYEEDSEEDSGPGEDQEPVATAAATTTV